MNFKKMLLVSGMCAMTVVAYGEGQKTTFFQAVKHRFNVIKSHIMEHGIFARFKNDWNPPIQQKQSGFSPDQIIDIQKGMKKNPLIALVANTNPDIQKIMQQQDATWQSPEAREQLKRHLAQKYMDCVRRKDKSGPDCDKLIAEEFKSNVGLGKPQKKYFWQTLGKLIDNAKAFLAFEAKITELDKQKEETVIAYQKMMTETGCFGPSEI